MKRRFLAAFLAVLVLVGSAGAHMVHAEAAAMTPGTYYASARGMDGEVQIAVTVTGDKIESIEIVDDNETAGVGDRALQIIGTYYAVKEYDMTRGEFGGLVTNDKAQVMTTAGEPIEGLYAAGLISSGDLIGDFYPGMEALGVGAYMGFIAGTEAAAHAAAAAANPAA